MRSEDEAKRKMKRRKKRKREKESKKGSTAADGDDGDGDAEDGGAGGDVVQASDEFEAFQVISAKHKVRSFAFAPAGSPHVRKGTLATVALALTTNVLELVSIGGEGASEVLCRLDQAGHRSDIRAVALSPDDSTLLSVSNGSAKAWNAVSGACTGTMDCGYGLCCMFAPGGRHAVVGTKEGTLEVFDLGQCSCVHVESAAHTGPVWSLAPLPDKSGFISGGADKQVRFWQWAVVAKDGGGGSKQLRLAAKRQMTMADDVLCVRVSPDGRLLAVALLDATIKVFFLDTLKFFLSLYGHKLPVLCMDISSDGTLLVSGSADKNIKVWGLDFGDCHKSLFAHQDSVMQVAFVRNTHYAFTAGKDKLVKYWDLDRNELLLELGGHHGEVWALAPSSYGDFIITGSHDRCVNCVHRV